MEFDNVPFDRMSPDSSQWLKGLQLAVNVLPSDAGAWRETLVDTVVGSVSVPASSSVAGAFGDSDGRIYIGTTRPSGPSSRLYQLLNGVFTNRTPGTDFAAAPAHWNFCQFGPQIIATPDNSSGSTLRMQVRTNGSGAAFAALVTSVDIPVPRYICVSHGHVVGGYTQTGGAGIYATEDPYQITWCDQNNADKWSPSTTNSAGFAPVNNSLGKITGICGFDDFFLLYQEFGVTRYTWVGGSFVWDAQGIGSHPWGLRPIWSPSIVRVDRDAYHWSLSGLAVVRNGEQVEQVGAGSVRRFFTDYLDSSIFAPGSGFALNNTLEVQGDYEPESGLVVWTGIKQFGLSFQIAYHPATDRFSVVDGSLNNSPRMATMRGQLPLRPAESFSFVGMNGLVLEVRRMLTTNPIPPQSQNALFYTSRWRPKTGQRVTIHGLRPLAAFTNAAGDPAGVTITVSRFLDPFSAAAVDNTTFGFTRNDSGWMVDSPLPMEGGEFAFQVGYQGIVGSGSRTLLEAPALEIAFSDSSSDI